MANGLEQERERRMQAEARLEHLERLVHQLAQQGDGFVLNGQNFPQQVAKGRLNGNIAKSASEATSSKGKVFNGSTHWSAMLADIEGLRSAIMPDDTTAMDDDMHEHEEDSGVSLILGAAVPLPLQQVLAQYLPSRQEADRLTAAYFRSRGLSAPFIHASSFRRLYQTFWKSPLRAPILWTSLLFSICDIAKNTLTIGKGNMSFDNRYRVASAHCLVLGEYYRPKRFSVESLLLFFQAGCLTNLGMSPDCGMISGLLIRLATRMGYHKDPDIFQFSPFECEIRRRTWSMCMQMDLLISFQLGLPSNIQFPTWNTQAPRNLQDSDFDENTEELPSARPDSEPTEVLFYIAKHKLMAVFEKILRHTLSTGTSEPTIVNALDAEIKNIYSAFPEILRPRPMAESIVDSPSMIVTRLCVFFVYQKSLCVLHRPYITQGQVYSTKCCCDAASSMVRTFNDTYREFLPSGQLETERWFMGNITWQDYLLAVTALCLVLCASCQRNASPDAEYTEALWLLRGSQVVFDEHPARIEGSKRVLKVVNATLLHFDHLGSQSNEDVSDESAPSRGPFGLSSMQSPFADDQVNGHVAMPSNHSQNFQPEQTEFDIENPTLAGPMDESSWAYLSQFLNLPDDDLMPLI